MAIDITAEYARQQTEINKQIAIDNILTKITEAYDAGEEMIQVDILSANTIKYLRSKGFNVNEMLAVQDMGIKISW